MPNLLISNVEKEMIAALKQRAKQNNRSVSGEIRAMLEDHLDHSAPASAQTPEEIALKWQNRLSGRVMPPLDDILQEIEYDQELREEALMGFAEQPQMPFKGPRD